MNLSCDREQLLSRLQIASRAVSTRATMQSLAGIMLSLEQGKLRIRASDMEIALDVSTEADVEGEGSVVLPGRLLVDVVRALPEGQVSFALREAERDVEISAGSARFHLRTLSADDFPKPPELTTDGASIAAAALTATVDLVARAASRDEARPILTGVLVRGEGDELTMVATDSYRLSVKRTTLPQPLAAPIDANVPARALRELSRIVAQEEIDEVRVSVERNQAVFVAGEITLASRLIEGQFPNYRQLLPESFEHEIRLPRDEVLDVVRRISYLAQRNAPLRLSFSEGELEVAAETQDVGDASESFPVGFHGEPLEIGFNPEFLRDGIESIEADELVMKLISPLRPGLIEPAESDDFTYLVMPIRLNV
jgi:DNA polymerase III subunit beta